ncbi:MAG: hypothetical protein AB7O52_06960 [Planctomycetota bacterium]
MRAGIYAFVNGPMDNPHKVRIDTNDVRQNVYFAGLTCLASSQCP